VKVYYYAWKGGPRLSGRYGSAEFLASYNEAHKFQIRRSTDTMSSVFELFQASPEFADLAPRTRKDYAKLLLILEREFGDFPISALEDRRARGDFLEFRDRLALRSRRQADYAYAVLARSLSWALNRGIVPVNPCERGGRVYRAQRSERVWSEEQEQAFYAAAPEHLHLPMKLALWTGQRQGDLLRLRWSDYDGEFIRLKQGKTGARVVIPVATELRAELDARRSRLEADNPADFANRTILMNNRGQAWTAGGFRASWRKACQKTQVEGLSFHDLRGTAVTRLALAGCTVAEIATITGHSLKDVHTILDQHYLGRTNDLGLSAIAKLEERQARKRSLMDSASGAA
jgi:integrase